MKLSKSQLDKVLAQVTDDVAALLKSEEESGEKLAKADPGEETPAEKKPEGSSLAPPAPEASSPAPEASSPAPEASSPAPEASSAPTDGDPAAEGQATPEALQAEYGQLDVEALKMHLMAAQAALMEKLGPTDQSPAPEASMPAPEASAPTPEMGKGELDEGNGGKVTAGKMAKNEVPAEFEERLAKTASDVASLKKQLEEKDGVIAALESNIGKVAEGIRKRLEAPVRKSISSISYMEKPGTPAPTTKDKINVSTLSKSEVTQKLREVTASKSLAKKDRDLVNSYMFGTVTLDKVEHLINE